MIRLALTIILLFSYALGTETKHITLQLRWYHQFQFAGYYAAVHKGFYREQGLDVTLLEGGPSINSLNRVLSGEADFGVSNSSLVIDYMNGAPVVMLGPIFQHSPNILLTHETIESPVDLASKGSVALLGGDQDVELKAMFLKEGIDLGKIRFVPDRNHLDDFIEHRMDAIYAYSSNEPFVLDQKKIPYRILEPRHYGLDFYGDLLFTSHSFVEHSPETVEKFRIATMRGWEYALEHPEEIIELILKNYNTQHKTREHLQFEAKTLSQLINPDFVQIGHSNPGRWEHIVSVYEEFGLLKQRRPLEAFFYAPEAQKDRSWLYLYFLPAMATALAMGSIAYYIYRINRRLEKSVSRHRVLFENSASAGIVWKEGYIITDWNAQAEKLFGWSREEVLGRNFFDFLVDPSESDTVKATLDKVWSNHELHIGINRNITKYGELIVCEWHNTQLPKNGDHYTEAVSQAIDITERLEREERLNHQATHDHLTALPNRKFFEELLEKSYAFASRHQRSFGLAFIDLDGFKAINDTYGHDAGDFLLKALASRFREVLRREDSLARFGGDEFAAILTETDDNEENNQMLRRILEAASYPVFYHGDSLNVSASMGVSFYTVQNNAQTEELLRQADMAMYAAKNMGKNRYHIYRK